MQRLAERYVGELSEMAKHSNLVTTLMSPTDRTLTQTLTQALTRALTLTYLPNPNQPTR